MGLRSGDWLGHFRTLMCFFWSHNPFVALAVSFGSLSCWNTHPQPFFNAPAGSMPWPWRYMAPSIVPLMRCSCPVPLAEKYPQSIMFPPPCLMVGMCSWGHRQHFSSSKHGELSWCQKAGFWSHLTTTLSPSSPLIHWQTSDGPVHVLSWAGTPCGRCRISVLHCVVCYQLFSWWLCSLGDYVPSCLEIIDKILPCSSGMIPHHSHDHWNSSRWDLAWTPRPKEIDSYFVFLPFTNNHTNCCHLVPKLLGDGLVAHSSLV